MKLCICAESRSQRPARKARALVRPGYEGSPTTRSSPIETIDQAGYVVDAVPGRSIRQHPLGVLHDAHVVDEPQQVVRSDLGFGG